MTDEILEKAKKLKEEIEYMEEIGDRIIKQYARIGIPKKRTLKVLFKNGCLFDIYRLPDEVQKDLFSSIEKYKRKLQKEYSELGGIHD